MTSIQYELKHPVSVAGVEVKSIRLRSPKVKDLLAAEKAASMESEREIHLIASLCGEAPAVIQELELVDYKELQKRVQGFM